MMRMPRFPKMTGNGARLFQSYFLAWFGMMILAIANGAFRDLAYKPRIGELPAHQVSTATLLVLFGICFRLLARCRPIPSGNQAWCIGGMWLVMTLAFEFGFGRFVAGDSWRQLLHAYNLFDGQVWVLIPLWVLTGPYVFFRLGQTPHQSSLD